MARIEFGHTWWGKRWLEAKKELADLTVSEGEQWLTKMSTGDLKELIELSEG